MKLTRFFKLPYLVAGFFILALLLSAGKSAVAQTAATTALSDGNVQAGSLESENQIIRTARICAEQSNVVVGGTIIYGINAPSKVGGREVTIYLIASHTNDANQIITNGSMIGKVTTDDNGKAKFSYKPTSTGIIRVAAIYKEDPVDLSDSNLLITAENPSTCEDTTASAAPSSGGGGGGQSIMIPYSVTAYVIDPFGIAFDIANGEPISAVTVTVTDTSGGAVSSQTASPQNPTTTSDSGRFNFFVFPGQYKMSAIKSGYSFPLSEAEIKSSSNFTTSQLANTCGQVDVLNNLALFGFHSLYHSDSIITVANKVVYTNLPMKSNGAPTTPTKPKITDAFVVPDTTNNRYVLYTEVTHLNTTITVYYQGKLIVSQSPQCQGFIAISIPLDPAKVNNDEIIVIADKSAKPTVSFGGAATAYAAASTDRSDPVKITLARAVLNNLPISQIAQSIQSTAYYLAAQSPYTGATLASAKIAGAKYASLGTVKEPYVLYALDATRKRVGLATIGSDGKLTISDKLTPTGTAIALEGANGTNGFIADKLTQEAQTAKKSYFWIYYIVAGIVVAGLIVILVVIRKSKKAS